MIVRSRAESKEGGSALALALLVMVVVSAMGFSFLAVTSSMNGRQNTDVETAKAFYITEAGLAEAFSAVRIGRSGQIGTEETPAAYGGGLLWVDATETTDGHVRLESRGFYGGARSSLSLVVEPVSVPLGFFADQGVVVHSGLVADGFDSSEATYTQELVRLGGGQAPDFESEQAEALELFKYYLSTYGDAFASYITSPASGFRLTANEAVFEFVPVGLGWTVLLAPEDVDPLMDNLAQLQALFPGGYTPGAESSLESFIGAAYDGYAEDPESYAFAAPPTMPENTGSGALLGSNGNVTLDLALGEEAQIYGDIVPGPEGAVVGLGPGVEVSGDTESRSETIELPDVEVPMIPLGDAVLHDGELPFLVPAGFAGYLALEVLDGSEAIVRGPATIVLGSLSLRDGGRLTLDTRDGDVSLYVTGSLDLDPGSVVGGTTEDPRRGTVQVSSVQGAGDPLVQLEAAGKFYGTLYAPRADVLVGTDFEVFGGIVARGLEVAPGAKLHFDNAGYRGTPIPRLVSWRIMEVPTTEGGRGASPFLALGVNAAALPPLAAAHNLNQVHMEIEYVNSAGAAVSYSGLESAFNWDNVSEVLEVSRRGGRRVQLPSGAIAMPGEAAAAAASEGASLEGDVPVDPLSSIPDPDPEAWHNQPSDLVPDVRKGITAALAGGFLMSDQQQFEALHKCSPLTDIEIDFVRNDAWPKVSDMVLQQLESYR